MGVPDPRKLRLLRRAAHGRKREHHRHGCVMTDVAGHVVVLVVNVAVEDGDIGMRGQQVDGRLPVPRRPVPLRVEREQGSMRQHDDGRLLRLAGEVLAEPVELRLAQHRRRQRRVVEDDEVNALVIEGVVQGTTEHFQIRLTAIQGCVVLAGEEPDLRHSQPGRDLAHFAQPRTTQLGIVGCLGQVASEDDEIRLGSQRVDRRDRPQQRLPRLGIDLGICIPPVHVGKLHEGEVARCRFRRSIVGAAGQGRRHHHPSHPGKAQEVSSIARHGIHEMHSAWVGVFDRCSMPRLPQLRPYSRPCGRPGNKGASAAVFRDAA